LESIALEEDILESIALGRGHLRIGTIGKDILESFLGR